MTLSDFKSWQIDNGQAAFMDYLYNSSGRTSSIYTGLWDEFCEASGGAATAMRLRDEWVLAFLTEGIS